MVISEQCVFDYSGCHNKVPSTGRLTQKKCIYLLTVLGAGSLRSGCQSGQAVVRVFFLVADCRLLAMFS